MKGLIFTYLLTYGGALASLVNPFVGLLIYVAFAILKPDALWAHSLPQGGRYSLIVALALLAGWALHGFGNWRFGSAKWVITPLLVFWAWLVISAVMARDPQTAWSLVENMSKAFLPCIVALSLIDSVSRLKAFAWTVVICQGYLAYEFNLAYYEYGYSDSDWQFAGLDNNSMAIAMDAVIGLAFFLGLYSKAWWQRGVAFLCAGLMVHFVLFSMSRGGMLGLVIMGAVVFWLIPKKPAHVLLFCLGVAAGLRLAGPAVVEEFMSIKEGDAKGVPEGEEAFSRTLLWTACIKVGLSNPIAGVGPGNWRVIAHEYGFTRGKASHTTWFNVLAEEGVPGFVSLLAFYGLCLYKLWPIAKQRRPVSDPWFTYLAGGVCAAIIGFCVSAQFVAIEGLEQPYYIGIIGAGVLKLNSLLPVAQGRFIPQPPQAALSRAQSGQSGLDLMESMESLMSTAAELPQELAPEVGLPREVPAESSPDDLPVTRVELKSGWQVLDLGELWRYRELLYILTWRDIKVRYKQTVLGAAWAILQPLATMVVFTAFLGPLVNQESLAYPYPIYVFVGLVAWSFFAGSISAAGSSVVGNQNLVTKVYFPRLMIPMGAMGPPLVDFTIAFVLLLGLMLIYGVAWSLGLLLVPFLLLGLFLAALGVGTLLSALTVAYRDFRHAVPFLVQLWMFATPVIYIPETALGPKSHLLLPLNPAFGLILNFRRSVLGQPLDGYSLGISLAVSLLFVVAGSFYFKRVERSFADII